MNQALKALAVLTAWPWCSLTAQDLVEWQVRAGDNIAWAAPDCDDSNWQIGSWPKTGFGANPDVTSWYRAHIVLNPRRAGDDLATALPPLFEIYELYVDRSHGSWADRQHAPFPAARVLERHCGVGGAEETCLGS